MDIIPVSDEEIDTNSVNACQLLEQRLINDWRRKHRSEHTQDAYRRDIAQFLTFVGMPLREVTITELLDYQQSLAKRASHTQNRKLASIKSLYTFLLKSGYIQANPASLLELQTAKNTLAERIMSRGQVDRLIGATQDNPRNHAIVRLLYVSGMRVSEICALTWRDVKERDNGMGQITIYGKGDKTRTVMLGPSAFSELVSLRGDATLDMAVFQSKKTHGHLDRRQVERIVTDAATKAGIKLERNSKSVVSPHWLRHAHACARTKTAREFGTADTRARIACYYYQVYKGYA